MSATSATDFFLGRAVDHQTECALGVVLADENDGAVKVGAGQFTTIKQELAPERLELGRHGNSRGAICATLAGLTTPFMLAS